MFAPPGTYIPGKDIDLRTSSPSAATRAERHALLGVELELSDDHEGIIELPDDAPVGDPYAQYAGLDDPVIEIKLTPNRPDCTGVHGIARDLARPSIGTLKDRPIKPVKGESPARSTVTLEFGREPCPALRGCAWCAASRTARRRSGCSSG